MSFFFFPFFQYSPKFCVANKYLTLIFLCYFFHTSSAFVFTVGLNLLWSMLLFPSSLRNTTLVFFWDAFFSIFLPCFSFFFWQPHWQDVLFQIQKSISCHHRRCDKMPVSAGVHFVEGIGVKKMWPPCLTTLVVSFFLLTVGTVFTANQIAQIFSDYLKCEFKGCMETKRLCFHVNMFSPCLVHPCSATAEADDGLTWSPTAHHNTVWQLHSGLCRIFSS